MVRRGKVKYKDVVKKHGGDTNKSGQKRKMAKKPFKRKTFSLFAAKDRNRTNGPKRKYDNSKPSEESSDKKAKLDVPSESSEESEHEDEDNMAKLLKTFAADTMKTKSVAVDSESDSESETEETENNVRSDGNFKSLESESDLTSDEEPDSEASSQDEDSTQGDLPKNDNDKDYKDEENERLKSGSEDEMEDAEDEAKEVEDLDDLKDPFVKHFFYELHDSLLESVQSVPQTTTNHSDTFPQLGRLVIQIPKCEASGTAPKSEFSISEEKTYAPAGEPPRRLDKNVRPEDVFIKTQIRGNLSGANKGFADDGRIFTPLQAEVFGVLNNYQDFYYPGRTFSNAEEIRFVYCLHAVNHVMKTRLKVLHHNARLSKKDEVPEEFRDQGLVRPKVLIILPFKDAAYKTIKMITDILLSEDKGNVMNKKRFEDDYTGNELSLPKRNPKPEDYEQLFQGNTSDDFKIGMTVTKKSLKLYADFYSSDIIVASPLGLRTIVGAEGEPERDYDFLASVELLVLDQAEVFLMQNWDHLLHVFNHLHLQPRDSHGTDFSRVRTWSLNGWAKYYRQTLIFSSLVLPEINAIFNKRCLNHAGKVRVANPVEVGCIGQVYVQLPHVFHRFDADTAAGAVDARFELFVRRIVPQQWEGLMGQTLVFVPDYFDFVRIRNHFKREDIGFVQICEYSKEGKVARARDMFFHGDARFLLYTERSHFFHRRRIKGARHIVFYQPPAFPHFYHEMCNLMQEANMNRKVGSASNMTVTVLYSKCDAHRLSAIVGAERAARMTQSDRRVHMMVTGGD